MHLTFINPYYDRNGYTADKVTLFSEDGELLGTATKFLNTGRWVTCAPDAVQDDTLLYMHWSMALSEASGITRWTINELDGVEVFK